MSTILATSPRTMIGPHRLPLFSLLLSLLPWLALPGSVGAAVPQADAAQVLLREGDVLPNGWVVEVISVPGIADDGKWAALVDADRGATSLSRVALVDGTPVLREGQVLPSGETLQFLLDVDLDPNGTFGAVFTVEPPVGVTAPQVRFLLGGSVVMRTGDAVPVLGLPPGSTIYTIRDVELALPFVFVRLELEAPNTPAPTFTAVLRLEANGTPNPSITVAAVEGATVSGALGPVDGLNSIAALASDGTYLTSMDLDVNGMSVIACLRGGLAVYQDGVAAPLGGSVWKHVSNPPVAKGPGGHFAIGSRVRLSSGSLRGIVYTDSGILARPGFQVLGGHGLIVGNFTHVALVQADNGDTIYKLPTTTGTILMAHDELLLQSGVSTASGATVISTKTSRRESVDVTSDGDLVIAEVMLQGGIAALVLIERRVGHVVNCTPVPNSTGQPGRLAGFGSSFVSNNNLTIVATQLPQNAFGYLACSRTPGFVANPGGSAGNLCLAGSVGRFIAQVQSSGSLGLITTTVDLTALPQPMGSVPGLAGQVWGFQLWHRDMGPGGMAVSNFTEALAVQLQ